MPDNAPERGDNLLNSTNEQVITTEIYNVLNDNIPDDLLQEPADIIVSSNGANEEMGGEITLNSNEFNQLKSS